MTARPTARLVPILTALLACAVVAAGPAAADAAEDQDIADATVLSIGDVPEGFEENTPQSDEDDSDDPPECAGVNKSARAIDATPNAESLFTVSNGDAYSLIRSGAAIFPKVGKAKKTMSRWAGDDAEACFAQGIEDGLAQPGATVDVSIGTFAPELDDKGEEDIITGGDDFLGYAGSARVSADGESVFYEFQNVYLRVGRGLAMLFVVNTGAIPTDDVNELVQLEVDRLQDVG